IDDHDARKLGLGEQGRDLRVAIRAVIGEKVGDLGREAKMRGRDGKPERGCQQDGEGRGAATPPHQGAPKADAISESGTAPFRRILVKRVSVVSPLASATRSETTSALWPNTTTCFCSLNSQPRRSSWRCANTGSTAAPWTASPESRLAGGASPSAALTGAATPDPAIAAIASATHSSLGVVIDRSARGRAI